MDSKFMNYGISPDPSWPGSNFNNPFCNEVEFRVSWYFSNVSFGKLYGQIEFLLRLCNAEVHVSSKHRAF